MASLPKVSYKGTEFACLDIPVRILEQLKCDICLELLSEPVSTSCKHLFCGNCIKDLTKCPKCRTEGFKTYPDYASTGVIKAFKVKCPNSTEGCEWQGELGDAHEHLRKKCEQTVCLWCGEKMKRRSELQIHTAYHCPNRPYRCPLCGHHGVYKDVTSSIHYTTCEEFPLLCPGGCHKRIARRVMKGHLVECPEEHIPCQYAKLGCDKVVKRREIDTHFRDQRHFKQLDKSQFIIYAALENCLTSNTPIKPDLASLPLSFRPWLQNSPTCYPRPPWVVKVSVYALLKKGSNDDNLKFPYKGSITVSLLNQEEDSNHHSDDLWEPNNDFEEDISGRVTTGETAEYGKGLTDFLSHEDLDYNSANNTAYLKSDSLFFRVDKFEPAW